MKKKKHAPHHRRKDKTLPKKEMRVSGSVKGTKGDPLDFQISVKVKLPRGFKLSAKVLTQAIRYRIEKGRSPRGMQLKIIRWRNPARKHTSPDWRYPDDPETIANVENMFPPSIAGRMSPQQAAWRTLSAAVEAVQVKNFTVRHN
jgi:hypothetical protein